MSNPEETMRRFVLAACTAFFVGAGPMRAQSGFLDPDVLAGLREVSAVHVLPVGDGCRKAGVDSALVRIETELALRRAGLRVGTGAVELFVATSCLYNSLLTTGNVDLFATELVTPTRIPGRQIFAMTWFRAMNVRGATPEFRSATMEALKSLLSIFENDWLAANPKWEE